MKRRVWLQALAVEATAGSLWRSALAGQRPGRTWAADFESSEDDSARLATALGALSAGGGGALQLMPGRTYRLTTQLRIPARCGLVGDGSSTLFAPADVFDNPDWLVREAPRAAVVNMNGQTSPPYRANDAPFLRGVRIRSEVRQGRFVNAIVARNVRDLRIEGCEITGFGLGAAIRAATLTGDSVIAANHIHHFTDDSVFPRGVLPQMTAIEIDNDKLDGRASVGVRIRRNRIEHLTVGPAFMGRHGWQTDGINIHHGTHGYELSGNVISGVGEGIDSFGRDGSIVDNLCTDCGLFGIKLIHGARANLVRRNVVRRAGKAGITVHGSDSADVGHTERNQISDNLIADVNPNGDWAAEDTACLLTGGNGERWRVVDNVFRHNRLDPGPRGGWAISRSSDGWNNRFANNLILRPGVLGNERPGSRETALQDQGAIQRR